MFPPAISPSWEGMNFMTRMMDTGLKVAALAVALGIGACVGATAAQPHMENALDALRTARSELQAAEPNKGGHRERAISLVNQAIDETRAGIDFARR
jgi:hypothetical protein